LRKGACCVRDDCLEECWSVGVMEHCLAAWLRPVAAGCKSVTQARLFCGRELQLPRACSRVRENAASPSPNRRRCNSLRATHIAWGSAGILPALQGLGDCHREGAKTGSRLSQNHGNKIIKADFAGTLGHDFLNASLRYSLIRCSAASLRLASRRVHRKASAPSVFSCAPWRCSKPPENRSWTSVGF
jgi:hypothetical protein